MAVEIEFRDHLLQLTLRGTITRIDLQTIGRTIMEFEGKMAIAPPRISDFSAAEKIEVGYAEMLVLAQERRASRLSNHVRSAIVVSGTLQMGMARMFQTLNDHPFVTIEIFDDREAALRWVMG